MAATAKKITRKDIKQPDEFVQTGQTIFGWISEHKNLVLGAVGGAVVLGLLLSVGSWWFERQETSAAGALGSALELASRPVLDGSNAEQASGQAFFESEDARLAAYAEALEAVRKDHPGTESAAVASLHLGEIAWEQARWDDAQGHYEAFLAEASATNQFRFAALEGLGLIQQAKGDQEGAVKAFQRLVDEGNTFYRPFGLVRLAEALERAGRADEARAPAQRVVDEFGTSAARRSAEAILERLPPPNAGAPAEG